MLKRKTNDSNNLFIYSTHILLFSFSSSCSFIFFNFFTRKMMQHMNRNWQRAATGYRFTIRYDKRECKISSMMQCREESWFIYWQSVLDVCVIVCEKKNNEKRKRRSECSTHWTWQTNITHGLNHSSDKNTYFSSYLCVIIVFYLEKWMHTMVYGLLFFLPFFSIFISIFVIVKWAKLLTKATSKT